MTDLTEMYPFHDVPLSQDDSDFIGCYIVQMTLSYGYCYLTLMKKPNNFEHFPIICCNVIQIHVY